MSPTSSVGESGARSGGIVGEAITEEGRVKVRVRVNLRVVNRGMGVRVVVIRVMGMRVVVIRVSRVRILVEIRVLAIRILMLCRRRWSALAVVVIGERSGVI